MEKECFRLEKRQELFQQAKTHPGL
jgi:hypothetical protein